MVSITVLYVYILFFSLALVSFGYLQVIASIIVYVIMYSCYHISKNIRCSRTKFKLAQNYLQYIYAGAHEQNFFLSHRVTPKEDAVCRTLGEVDHVTYITSR